MRTGVALKGADSGEERSPRNGARRPGRALPTFARRLSRSLGLLLLASFIVLSACGGTTSGTSAPGAGAVITLDAPTSFTAIDPGVAKTWIDARIGADDFTLLDIRTGDEIAAGYIAGATTGYDFYSPDFATKIGALDRTADYVVYCRSGNRSGQAVEIMRRLGFTSVTDIAGGIVAWAEDGLPVTTP